MKLNKRTTIVNKASIELEAYLITWQNRHDLTDLETIVILTDCLRKTEKYALRLERHGNYEKRADEE